MAWLTVYATKQNLRKNVDYFALQILTSMLRIWQGLQGVSRRNLRAEPDTRDQQIFAIFVYILAKYKI
jgi:hypothetical protein